KRVRAARPHRPVVLVLTCLHEAYPQQQHPLPYPFDAEAKLPEPPPEQLANLAASIAEQRRHFDGLVDRGAAGDLTPAHAGLNEANYGGERLGGVLSDALAAAQAQSLRTLEAAQRDLQDLFARRAIPTILGYSSLAATAGAVPIPFVDLVLISGIQTRMVYDL